MAEYTRDTEDRMFESLFASAPVADDGFSVAVVRRLRRRIWLRRLALPVAAVVGGLISFKPLVGLVSTLADLSALFPDDIIGHALGAVPQLQTLALGAVLLAACLLSLRMLED